MKIIDKAKIMSRNPTQLHTIKNRFDQEVIFYEHPIYGDEASIIGVIDETAFSTGFFDCGSFYDNSDYNPILYDGKIHCDFEINNDFIDKGLFQHELIGKA